MSTEETKKTGINQRSLRNFLLDPLLQVKLGLYSIVLSAFFTALICVTLYLNFSVFVDMVLTLTDSEDMLQELFIEHANSTLFWGGVLFATYLLSVVVMSITLTHRLIGPTIAFRRMVSKMRDGDYSARVHLRKGDSFVELADDLNHLAQDLEKKLGNDHADQSASA